LRKVLTLKGNIMKKVLQGLNRYNLYNEHMDCVKGCLDCLGQDITFPWLYGGTGQAFVLNMNANVFVDAAQAWDIDTLFALGPNLGWQTERLYVEHEEALQMSDQAFQEAQLKAWDFVVDHIDQGLPCYAWELSPIPNYNGIFGYEIDDDYPEKPGAYLYKGYSGISSCRWDAMGTFDVKLVHVLSVIPGTPAAPDKVVRDALIVVLDRIEKRDGWVISDRYTTGLPAYQVWAKALENGAAIRDGHSYLTRVWLENRQQAVKFLEEAQIRLPGTADTAFEAAITYYTETRDALQALYDLHPDRQNMDWSTQFQSQQGAALVRKAADAEALGVEHLKDIVKSIA
jgi:hypothetical protein